MLFSNNKLFNIKDVLKNSQDIKSEYESFSIFCEHAIKNNNDGFMIDNTIVNSSAINIILHDDISGFNGEFLNIKVHNSSDFIKLAKKANATSIMLSMNGEMGIVAYYNCFKKFPVARLYAYQFVTQEEYLWTIEKMNKLSLDYKPKNHDKLIDKTNVRDRIEDYKKEKKERYKYIEKFAQGRIENTDTAGAMIIAKEDDTCVSCNKKLSENLGIENISFLGDSLNILFVMEVCRECVSNSEGNNMLLNSIFEVSNTEKKLKDRELTIDEIREYSRNIVQFFLNAKIDLEKSTASTITAIRQSGYILKLRLDDISDYGYIILLPNEEELVQFDNANHHDDILEYPSHHVHNDKPHEHFIKKLYKKFRNNKKKRKELKNSKNITDSFLTGYLGLDFVSIKKKLEELENITN